MDSVGKAFLLTLCLSLLFLLNYSLNYQSHRELPNDLSYTYLTEATTASVQNTKTYKFKDPVLAYQILTQLDVFKPADEISRNENVTNYGLKSDDHYCEKHRAFVVEFPESIFEEMNFIISEPQGSLMRSQIIPSIGNDIDPHIGVHMPQKDRESFLYDIKPFVNIFFTKNTLSDRKHIGKHYSCLTQISNHIPGDDKLSRKFLVTKAITKYAELYKNRPQCFSYDRYFPKGWSLTDKESCKEFFDEFNSPEYQRLKKERKIVYIRKVGESSHRGEGVEPVHDKEENELRKDYDNGKLCGLVQKNYIIQTFVYNPLLLEGRKFDFRMYMLVSSTNPLIAYYHDGSLRVSLMQYDSGSNEKKALLTNIALNKQIYENAKKGILYEGMDEEALRVAQEWTFEKLQAYLLNGGVIKDQNWLENYLRPEFKRAMIHLLRLSQDSFLKRSSVYQLFGVDFMLDENLKLWFIEANAGPGLGKFSEPVEKLVVKMLKDHFEIVFGLLRSRMKRIVQYVNWLIGSCAVTVGEEGEVAIQLLDAKRTVFEKITQNYFDKEFEPSPGNGFFKIIDENLKGIDIYQGFMSEDCL